MFGLFNLFKQYGQAPGSQCDDGILTSRARVQLRVWNSKLYSLNRQAFVNSLVHVSPVHDAEYPNFVFDDLKHYAIVSDA